MNLTEIGRKGVFCLSLAQDRDIWLAIVNTERISFFYTKCGICFLAKKPVASQARLLSMALEILVKQFN
jgi:hypothetical protein